MGEDLIAQLKVVAGDQQRHGETGKTLRGMMGLVEGCIHGCEAALPCCFVITGL
jgi:hypothetical protein